MQRGLRETRLSGYRGRAPSSGSTPQGMRPDRFYPRIAFTLASVKSDVDQDLFCGE